MVIQINDEPYASKLIKLGSIPLILILDESPIILFSVYDKIGKYINKFKYYACHTGTNELLKAKNKVKNFSAKFIEKDDTAYHLTDIDKIQNTNIEEWKCRKYSILIASNKFNTYNFLASKNLRMSLLKQAKHVNHS